MRPIVCDPALGVLSGIKETEDVDGAPGCVLPKSSELLRHLDYLVGVLRQSECCPGKRIIDDRFPSRIYQATFTLTVFGPFPFKQAIRELLSRPKR